MRKFATDSQSFPIYALAETHGISRAYAMLLADEVALQWDAAPAGAWPAFHYWYDWAHEHAIIEHGVRTVARFRQDLKDMFDPDTQERPS